MSRTFTIFCPTGQRLATQMCGSMDYPFAVRLLQRAQAGSKRTHCPRCNRPVRHGAGICKARTGTLVDWGRKGVACTNCEDEA